MTAARRNIRLACIGLGAQGLRDLRELTKRAKVVVICDNDPAQIDRSLSICAGADTARDFEDVFLRDDLDAISIALPDAQHAAVALNAIRSGLHCFCQKPLSKSSASARELATLTTQFGVATQLGLQGLFHGRAARTLRLLRSGVIGDPIEVHAWATGIPVPPYAPAILNSTAPTGSWRWSPEIGTGVLGDLGSHALAMFFAAFEPRFIEAGSPVEISGIPECHPWAGSIELVVATTHGTVPIKWYQGGLAPPDSITAPIRKGEAGAVIVGTEGTCYLPGLMNQYAYFLPRDRFQHLSPTGSDYSVDIFDDWIDACFEGRALARFDGFALQLTTAVTSGASALLSAHLGLPAEAG
jgi:predicted dehydrogenase